MNNYNYVKKLKLIDEKEVLKENEDNKEFMEIYNSLKMKNRGKLGSEKSLQGAEKLRVYGV